MSDNAIRGFLVSLLLMVCFFIWVAYFPINKTVRVINATRANDIESLESLLPRFDCNLVIYKQPNSPNLGYTILHLAAENSNAETVKLLLDHGANPCLQNDRGETALHIAIGYREDFGQERLDVVKVLCQDKTVLNISDKHGQTPLGLCTNLGDKTCQILLRGQEKKQGQVQSNESDR